MLHVSQPQMHNVLKGNRRLQWDLADEMLRKLSITILDLVNFEDQSRLFDADATNGTRGPHTYAKLLPIDVPSIALAAPRKPPSIELALWPARRRSV